MCKGRDEAVLAPCPPPPRPNTIRQNPSTSINIQDMAPPSVYVCGFMHT